MAPLSHILSSLACLQSILQVKCDQFYVNKGPGRDSHRTQIDEEHLTKSPDITTHTTNSVPSQHNYQPILVIFSSLN